MRAIATTGYGGAGMAAGELELVRAALSMARDDSFRLPRSSIRIGRDELSAQFEEMRLTVRRNGRVLLNERPMGRCGPDELEALHEILPRD